MGSSKHARHLDSGNARQLALIHGKPFYGSLMEEDVLNRVVLCRDSLAASISLKQTNCWRRRTFPQLTGSFLCNKVAVLCCLLPEMNVEHMPFRRFRWHFLLPRRIDIDEFVFKGKPPEGCDLSILEMV